MNKQRDDKSVRSESSNVSFSSSKLGQMLAKEGFHPTQDFNVPQCSNHVTGNLKNVNVRHQGRRSERNSDDVSLLSTGSATASFSETALGQMLASQGMKASQDFPVSHMAPAPVKKNLVRKILQSKAPSQGLRCSTKSTSSRRRESRKKNQGRQSRVEEDQIHFEESSQSFVFPITVDLNDNLEVDFGELEGSDHNPGIVLIDDNAMDGYYDDAKDPECFHDEEPFSGDDLYLVEFGAQGYQDRHLEFKGAYHDDTNATSVRRTRSSPYRDNISTRSTRSVPWPDEPEKDPYRDNLQACEISALTIKKVGKNRRRVWLWCSIALIVVSVLVWFLTQNSVEERKPLENQTESAETSLEATLPATTISNTTATTPEWQPDIHLDNDPRFFHNWTKASKDAPIVDYALHPVRENTKLLIDIVAPLDAGEPIRLHVFYKDEATMSAGDVGCGDYTVQTMDSGATTSLRIDAFHTTQIVVCAQDTVIATATHLFVDDWNGNEMVRKYNSFPHAEYTLVSYHFPVSSLFQRPTT